jgi:subtilisin family serine protease
LVVAGISWTSSVEAGPRWRLGEEELPRLKPAELPAAVLDLLGTDSQRHVVVQFDQPVIRAERKRLQAAGIGLQAPLGDHAYFATLAKESLNAEALSHMNFVTGVAAVERHWKLDPRIALGGSPAWAVVAQEGSGAATVGLYVLFHPDVALRGTATDAVKRHGAVVRDTIESINGLVIEVPEANIAALADEDAVQWVEYPLPRMSEINDSNRIITQATIVQAAPYGLDGSGVNVLIYDGGQARATHVDFEGRLVVGAGDTSGVSDHSTHVACTVGGGGVANPAYGGMAPGVDLVSYGFEYDGTGIFLYSNPGDIESDYSAAINTYGAVISNNSIGTNTEPNGFDCTIQGNYGVTSALIDAIVRGSLGAPFRIAWANGNERQGSRCDIEGYGDYYSTAPPAGAKNHITVGALNSNDDSMTSFSSWGPVDDGRMKPDISGPGCQSSGDFGVTSCSSASDTSYNVKCGTSMAAPTVAGLLSLLLQDFRAQFPGDPDPRNATLKILLAHNAVDRGNAGPDHQFGYGSVRIQDTIDFMRGGSFLENTVDQGGTYSVLVVVGAGDPELRVTLAWDDVPGTPNVDPALVNDLDLRVFDPSSQQHYPWTLDPLNPSAPAVQTQANTVDNIEQVYVAGPAPGVWRVDIVGTDVPSGPQPFSVATTPNLVACSTAGTIALNASKYPCTATAEIQVIDCDLNTDDNLVETVSVTVDSTSEPGGESVLLTETGAETADFRGSVPIDTVDSAGVLLVADGDGITATYIDADDGFGGTNVPVTDAAVADCSAPVISSVQTTDLGPFSATVTFDTDEAANGSVRYGMSCASLSGTASESGLQTGHSVELTGLQENSTYFYAVDAVDEAGNAGSDDNGGSCYTFNTPDIPNYFTELFGTDNDLDNVSLTFTPSGSIDYYSGCAEPSSVLPVDPAGGTPLSLGDDSFAVINLSGGQTVSLYGTSYGTFYVGSNGYVTFGSGDNTYIESIAGHFDRPRISALFDDFNPLSGGTISWKQLADRAVVTWQNLPEYGTTNSNTFQVEMRFDGTIVISYLAMAPVDGLAGLSEGNGEPPGFFESDLSALGACGAPTCSDGIQNQGEDRIDCGGPCPPCDCLSDGECDDGQFCNGAETCDAFGQCQSGSAVDCDDGVGCTVDSCDEGTDSCDNVSDDGACDDGQFCNGAETCHPVSDCQPGGDPCPGEDCDEVNNVCVPLVCVINGTCDLGEDCNNCPADCISGSTSGAVCGNGVCEAGNGEDCVSCAADCNGVQSGNPAGRFCCGDGDGQNPISCSNPACSTGGWLCTDVPVSGGSYCCGDATCDGAEDSCNCAVDCGAPPSAEVPGATCSDGQDNDCDGGIDCQDSTGDCDADPSCQVVDCAQFTNKTQCNAQPSCRWDNKNKVCVPN